MGESVLERAAVACAFYRYSHADGRVKKSAAEAFSTLDNITKEKYRAQARAVLNAVLDLPDDIEHQAMKTLSEVGAAYYPRHISDYHQATISAILEQ